MPQQPQDPYTPDPYGQGPYRPERIVPTEPEGGGLKLGRLVLLGLAGGGLLYLGLSLFTGGDERYETTDVGSVPLVRANPEPSKVPPEDPGGLEVPDQDKLIFGQIGGANPDSGLPEQLLPPPPEPMARPTAPVEEPVAPPADVATIPEFPEEEDPIPAAPTPAPTPAPAPVAAPPVPK